MVVAIYLQLKFTFICVQREFEKHWHSQYNSFYVDTPKKIKKGMIIHAKYD